MHCHKSGCSDYLCKLLLEFFICIIDTELLKTVHFKCFKPERVMKCLSKKTHFWTFWGFLDWIWAKLAPVFSERHLQHDNITLYYMTSSVSGQDEPKRAL